jgi:hypothetical protein
MEHRQLTYAEFLGVEKLWVRILVSVVRSAISFRHAASLISPENGPSSFVWPGFVRVGVERVVAVGAS